jgi:hypothetical protein
MKLNYVIASYATTVHGKDAKSKQERIKDHAIPEGLSAMSELKETQFEKRKEPAERQKQEEHSCTALLIDDIQRHCGLAAHPIRVANLVRQGIFPDKLWIWCVRDVTSVYYCCSVA